jgi:heme/copper-type cytochrome/quinol oxidase subunit 2
VFSEELSNLIIRVITSWQVIVVTVVLILYFMLVSYVSRLRHHSRPSAPGGPPKKAKNKGESPEAVVTEDDGLGLEEE